MSCESSEPEDDGGDDEFGSPVGEPFGVTGSEVAELFETSEASLDHIAVPVDLGIEVSWTPTNGALGQAASDLVRTLRTGEPDLASTQGHTGRGMRVRLVSKHPHRSFAGSARSDTAHADLVQQRQKLRIVAGLAGGDQDRHRQTAPVDREMDLAGQPAPRAPEAFTFNCECFDPPASGPPFFRAPAACW